MLGFAPQTFCMEIPVVSQSKPAPVPSGCAALKQGWQRGRYGLVLFFLLSLLAGCTLLRVVLYAQFHPAVPVGADVARAFLTGFQRDLLALLLTTVPLLFWFWILPERRFNTRWHRVLLTLTLFLFWFVQVFLYSTEYYFFEEFKSRFNTVAVDYLIYPHEVFVNIWESYPVTLIVGVCASVAGAWTWGARRLFRTMWMQPVRARWRFAWLAGALVLAIGLGQTMPFKGVRFSRERVMNELANNGSISFFAAALTRNLDYAAFYKTLQIEESYARVRKWLAEPGVEFVSATNSIQRRIPGDASRPRLNVVLLMEESLGSEFFGSLGRKRPTLTPEMDKLAAEEGMLFTNVYATGNRTVRGFEGILSSFPPLPGDSIVKRDQSENVETIARVLKRDGYQTLFLYGGRAFFDNLGPFTSRNGYDRVVEQKHFAKPTFTTAWGVCDEDLFMRGIEELRSLNQSGKPFLATFMSVSNHKPYTYPKGRIPEDPAKQKRSHAVKYSDYALGQFFKAAKKEAFWTNTIFVMVADHGARVYGSQTIPMQSYEVPLLIAGPAVVQAPSRQGMLGCLTDVTPTVLGLLGRPYESMFFGRDLLKQPGGPARVLINHNRDIGLYAQERMIVLSLMQTVEYYRGDPKAVELERFDGGGPLETELEKDAAAFFQVADDLYIHRRYRIDP